MLSPAPEWGPALDKHRTGPYKGTSAETNGVRPLTLMHHLQLGLMTLTQPIQTRPMKGPTVTTSKNDFHYIIITLKQPYFYCVLYQNNCDFLANTLLPNWHS